MRKFSLVTALLVAAPILAHAQWQVPTNNIPYGKGQGKVGFGSTTNPGTGTQCLLDTAPPTFGPCGAAASLPLSRIFIGNASSISTSAPMTKDCSIAFSAGNAEITCTKTNNVAFGTAATVDTGTSGATIPLLNAANTFSGANTFSATQTIDGGAGLAVTNSLGASTRGLIQLKNATTGTVGSIQGLSGANTIAGIDLATAGAANSGQITFLTGNAGAATSKVWITKEGYISFGNSAPTNPLWIEDTNTNGSIAALVNTSVGGKNWKLKSMGSAANAGAFVITDATGGNDRFKIDTSGTTVLGGGSTGTLQSTNTGINGVPGCLNSDGATPATIVSGSCGTGLPGGGTVGQTVLNVSAGTGNWFTPEKFNLAQNPSTDCTGATATVISTVGGSNTNWLVPPGCTLKISADDTVVVGKTLTVACGATINVDNTKTLTIKGQFFDPGPCVIFGGSGTVTGIAKVRPEWWSCPGNASTFDDECLQSAINSITVAKSGASVGTEYSVNLGCKTYYINTMLTVTLISGASPQIVGCGEVTGHGSAIIAKSTFTGDYGLKIQADSSTVCCIDFTLKNFSIQNEAVAGGPAVAGIGIINSLGSSVVSSFNASVVDRVFSSGFGIQFYVENVRQVTFNNIVASPSDSSNVEKTSPECIRLVATGTNGFVGDINIWNMQCVSDHHGSGTPTGYGMRMLSTGSGANANGIRCIGCVFYGGATQWYGETTSGGSMRDHWIGPSTQFEGANWTQSKAIHYVFGAGANNGTLFIANNYFAGHGHQGDITITGAPTVGMFAININNNLFANASGGGYSININGSGADSRGHNINGNIFHDPSTGGLNHALIYLQNSTRFTVNGNVCHGSATSRPNFIAFLTTQYYMGVGNNSGGCTVSGSIDTTGSSAPGSISGNM